MCSSMKVIIVIAVLMACVYGAPQDLESEHDALREFEPEKDASPEPISILKQENFRNPDGSYRYSYETENGTKVMEEGYFKNAGTDEQTWVVQGEYTYTGDDGQVYRVTYIADENGFQPSGGHLPTPPPIV